jgi:hypothetical protein
MIKREVKNWLIQKNLYCWSDSWVDQFRLYKDLMAVRGEHGQRIDRSKMILKRNVWYLKETIEEKEERKRVIEEKYLDIWLNS